MSRRTTSVRCAFTLVELLAVIAIIVVLMSILLVAMSGARKGALRASASRQLATITTALDTFEQDFGWYPPLLVNNDDTGSETPLLDNGFPMHLVPEAMYRYGGGQSTSPMMRYRQTMSEARYHSSVTLTQYLVGAGDLNGDGVENYDVSDPSGRVEPNFDDGLDGPGIRHPGAADKSWGGGADRTLQVPTSDGRTYADDGEARLTAQVAPPRGREYGPYLDPGLLADSLVRREDGMFDIHDAYGYPIRYYRGFPTRELVNNDRDLAVVPIELRSVESVDAQQDGDLGTANTLDKDLLTAEFVLLSCGAEGREAFDDLAAFPKWIGPKDDGLVPPFGDIVRDHGTPPDIHGVLLRLQETWGDRADKDELDTLLKTLGINNLVDALETNVRSVR